MMEESKAVPLLAVTAVVLALLALWLGGW